MKNRGSALAIVVGVAAVLFILTGVVYTYFKMNATASIFRMNSIRAAVAADAGTNLALHFLSTMETYPDETTPFLLAVEGDSAGWINLPDCGKFLVVIDPINGQNNRNRNGAVEIRSRGLAGDVTRDVIIRAAPAYPSSYALLTDNGIPQGYFVDGQHVNGPVHSNGQIVFSSFSPDSTNDPHVDLISTTADGGFIFIGYGESDIAHPEGSNIWVQPYSRHAQGKPFWMPVTSEIDFARMTSHFQNLSRAALNSSTVHIRAERLLINRANILYKESEQAPEQTLSLQNIDLIVVENGFAPVVIKSINTPISPLTIITKYDLVIGGGIDGGAVGSGGPLGLVALGNVIIPVDPEESGTQDWSGNYDIETNTSFLLRACIVALNMSFKAATPYLPQNQCRITITGSLVERTMGRLSSANSGYDLRNTWDPGLGALHPPHFPLLGRWNIYSWILDPPQTEGVEIDDDIV